MSAGALPARVRRSPLGRPAGRGLRGAGRGPGVTHWQSTSPTAQPPSPVLSGGDCLFKKINKIRSTVNSSPQDSLVALCVPRGRGRGSRVGRCSVLTSAVTPTAAAPSRPTGGRERSSPRPRFANSPPEHPQRPPAFGELKGREARPDSDTMRTSALGRGQGQLPLGAWLRPGRGGRPREIGPVQRAPSRWPRCPHVYCWPHGGSHSSCPLPPASALGLPPAAGTWSV